MSQTQSLRLVGGLGRGGVWGQVEVAVGVAALPRPWSGQCGMWAATDPPADSAASTPQ